MRPNIWAPLRPAMLCIFNRNSKRCKTFQCGRHSMAICVAVQRRRQAAAAAAMAAAAAAAEAAEPKDPPQNMHAVLQPDGSVSLAIEVRRLFHLLKHSCRYSIPACAGLASYSYFMVRCELPP